MVPKVVIALAMLVQMVTEMSISDYSELGKIFGSFGKGSGKLVVSI